MCVSRVCSKPVKPPTTVTEGTIFYCSKLNDSTHLVVQKDEYYEYPFIYVKVYPTQSLAVVIDTGCGAHKGEDDGPSPPLKSFIMANVLNSNQNGFEFLIICTHCHYDHIGGIEAFSTSGAKIVASGHDLDFLSPDMREENSLCGAFDMKTPRYEVDYYASDGERLNHHGHDLGLCMIHTPGHTPDSMAIYDQEERWLFIGDTCYQRVATMPWTEEQDVAIILPLQGNWKDFVATLQKLRDFVAEEDAKPASSTRREMKLAAGHTTSQAPAADFLRKAASFVKDVASGRVPILARIPGDVVAPGGSLGDEMFVLWQDDGKADFSLRAPESFMDGF
ncbi:hypothetical protein Q7P37_011107 [Cladosporium fusiforme]